MQAPALTSLSLLRGLKHCPSNESAWDTFVERYGSQILAWCRFWGLQEADAEDVAQETLHRIAKGIQRFDRQDNGSFRAWLKTVTRHACYDLARSLKHESTESASVVIRHIDNRDATDDLAKRLEEAWEQELLQTAYQRVRQRVQSTTWMAFELTAIEGQQATDAANRLGIALASVYKAKSNVTKLLQEEVENLEASEWT